MMVGNILYGDDCFRNPFWRGRIMKPSQIVACTLLIVLVLIGIFRWDDGPSQSFGNSVRVQHYKDRITNQSWLKLYGAIPKEDNTNNWDINWSSYDEPWKKILHGINVIPDNNSSFAGKMYPYFTDEQIVAKSKKLLSGPKGLNKKRSLEKALHEAQLKEISCKEYHLEYLETYNSLKSDRSLLKEAGGLSRYAWKHNIEMPTPDYIILQHMPQDLISKNNEWKKANNQVKSVEYQISHIHYWAKREAKMELTHKAERIRNLVTIIWAALIVIVFVETILPFFNAKLFNTKKSTMSNVP